VACYLNSPALPYHDTMTEIRMNAIFSSGRGFPALWQPDDFAGRPHLPNVEAHLPFSKCDLPAILLWTRNPNFPLEWVNCVSYWDDTSDEREAKVKY
jgi:hypothetical protein